MTQGSLFHPTQAGEQPTLEARLLARRDDPQTSRDAAVRIAPVLSYRQSQALACLRAHGPGTTHELAQRACRGDLSGALDRQTGIHHELARRLPELERDGLVRTTGERRNGSRVWEVVDA